MTTNELREAAQGALNACERIIEQYEGWPQCGIDFVALRNGLSKGLAALTATTNEAAQLPDWRSAWKLHNNTQRGNGSPQLPHADFAAGWRAALSTNEAAAQAEGLAGHVGDTLFEGWLSCHEPDRTDGRSPRYTRQDMRDAYWAGYQEAAALAAQPVQAQGEAVAIPDGLSRSDAEFWLRHRAQIIEACRAQGFTIVSTARGVHLMKLGEVKAQAAPAVDRGLSEALRQIVRQHELQVHIAAYGYSKCVREMAELAEIKGEPHEIAAAALAASAPRQAEPRPTDDQLWDQTLRERDAAEEWADKLAGAIATHFGIDIGEHTSNNSPWLLALDAIREAAPSQAEPIGNLGPLDPNEGDASRLWAEIVILREMLKGPPGFTSWQDAAVHERMAKNEALRKLKALAPSQAEGTKQINGPAPTEACMTQDLPTSGPGTPAGPPTRSQRMREAGFTARDTRIECDECGAKCTPQMLPIHKCAPSQAEPLDGKTLWLWQNGDHYLAFEHLYPCYSPGGDPMTLGEPFGRAIFKSSFNRDGKPNERQSNDGQGAWNCAQPDVQRRHATGGGETHAAGAGASTGYAQCATAPQARWNAGDHGAWPVEIPDASRAPGVLAAQGAIAGGVIAPTQAGSCQASGEAKALALYEAIKHGDDVHREWLREAVLAWFAGRPVPEARSAPPAGRTLTEAEIDDLVFDRSCKPRLAEAQARAALRELVALKDMKDRMQRLDISAHELETLADDYFKRKPAAWAAARAILAASSTTAGERDHG